MWALMTTLTWITTLKGGGLLLICGKVKVNCIVFVFEFDQLSSISPLRFQCM
jgi:hypothetical protein